MSDSDLPVLNYSRQSLRKATKFVEGDYTGINPRQFYRSLKRSLEEIQEGGDFKYTSHGTQDEDLNIQSEDVGEKTGRVRGRLMATSDPREVGNGQIKYKPYGPHGAAGLVIGGLILLIGLASSPITIGGLGVLIMIGSGYMYFQSEEGEFAIEREDVIRALMTGEVSERTIEDADETRTDIFANMSVIYAGDALLNVSLSGLEDMKWTLRRAITTQVNKWFNRVVENEEDMIEVNEGFMAELSSWANRSVQSDRTTIMQRQSVMNDDFDMRIQYTDILMEQLPRSIKDELSEHQESLLDELESLSEDMDVYVEREGLERVS